MQGFLSAHEAASITWSKRNFTHSPILQDVLVIIKKTAESGVGSVKVVVPQAGDDLIALRDCLRDLGYRVDIEPNYIKISWSNN
jgi:hypothetical protein